MQTGKTRRTERYGILASAVIIGLTSGAGLAAAQDAADTAKRTDDSQTQEATSDTALAPIILNTSGNGETKGYQPVDNSSAMRGNMPILDIPQAVNVVSDAIIQDQNARSLDDVLNNVSNINQTNTLAGTQDSFIRRGFGDNRDGSVLTNGLRTVLPRSFNATTDRVEVLKGPSSALYGIQEPGGVINVLTKRPQQKFGGSISATGSSFGGGSTQFDVTGPIGDTDFAYRLIGSYQNVDYWRNYGKTKEWLLSPSIAWFGEDTTVNLSYTHRDYVVPFDRGQIFDLTTGHAVTTDPKIQFTEPYNVTDGTSDLVSLNVEHDLSDDWKLRFDYNYSRDAYSDNQARIMSYDPATGDLTRRADSTNGSTQFQHAFRLDALGDVEIAGHRNEILLGASYSDYDLLRSDMIRCGNVQDFNIYNPVYGTLPKCTTVVAKDSDQTIQQKLLTAYAQDSFYLTDDLILVGGLTFQHYTQYAGKGRPFVVGTDAEGFEVTPRAGIVYKATPTWSFYGNVATSFMPQTSIADYIGELPPEKGVSYEIGTKFELFDGITATAALFHIDKENVLYNEFIDGVTYARTAGHVRSQGFELDLAGALTENWSVIASYGYTNAKIIEDPTYAGKQPVNVAKHTASLYLTYDFGEFFRHRKHA
ncbi:TonB-dependent siderophore receptor [Neorhizobium alkalisoli]|uniref:Iron complex outermembrane receptor protein n=1 Tax=Neorhizobium alkalisoli TaxID=528178 RepID=A0A561R8V0_9HYPH|nr:TonB-dependent siderophore receptor [Neorhizobium alkalisoli]TWF59046.1 iron complex outermembrane receptor protein [Neorhizobium alkalisoli]